MKAVLLAAGKGTRMQGLCDDLPKPVLPIGNRPILAYTLAQLERAGVGQALLVVGHGAEQVRTALGAACGRVALDYAVQHDPKGTGQAAALAEDFVAGEPFLLMFGDIVTAGRHLPGIVEVYAAERPDAILAVRHVPDPASGGAVYVQGRRVVRIVERPTPGETTTHYINAGIFVFPPVLFELLRQVELSPRGEYELTEAIHALVEAGRPVRACELDGFWINVTDPSAYLEAQRQLFTEEPPPARQVPQGVAVAAPVAIGPACRLAPCQIGPNVSLGAGCTVGQGTEVRDAILMDGAGVGAGARVANAVVGRGGRVRDGSAVLGTPEDAGIVGHGETA